MQTIKKIYGCLQSLAFCLCLAQAGCLALPSPPPAGAGETLGAASAGSPPAPLLLNDDDRIMVLAPHPDDESLAAGGLIQQALARKLPVKVVFFTYGDNNELSFMLYRKRPVVAPSEVRRMGEVRHAEALRAAAVLGLAPADLVFLGYPDFGTLDIWERHWGDAPAFGSMLTRVRAVSYPDAFRPGAAYRGEEILRDLETLLRDFRPTVLLVSHPADFNPDHRALYAFTRVALWNLAPEIQPRLLPYLVHFKQWPAPRGYHPDAGMTPPPDLLAPIQWQTLPLPAGVAAEKRRALQAHASQYAYSAKFLDAFVRRNEIFGSLPPVRLRRTATPASLDADVSADEVPEVLTGDERAEFVGIEKYSAAISNGTLCLTLDFRRPLTGVVQASVFCCGYRADTPFDRMPKIQVRIGATRSECLDGGRPLPRGAVAIERHLRRLEVKIPLAVAGNPDRALVCARTYLEELPLDWAAWRVLEFQ